MQKHVVNRPCDVSVMPTGDLISRMCPERIRLASSSPTWIFKRCRLASNVRGGTSWWQDAACKREPMARRAARDAAALSAALRCLVCREALLVVVVQVQRAPPTILAWQAAIRGSSICATAGGGTIVAGVGIGSSSTVMRCWDIAGLGTSAARQATVQERCLRCEVLPGTAILLMPQATTNTEKAQKTSVARVPPTVVGWGKELAAADRTLAREE